MYVDYSKAFTVNFTEIEKAEVGFQDQKSKAGIDLPPRVVGNTIYQPLNRNKKNTCKTKHLRNI